jgi:hypothetical protein
MTVLLPPSKPLGRLPPACEPSLPLPYLRSRPSTPRSMRSRQQWTDLGGG